jgi:hypothetical protein
MNKYSLVCIIILVLCVNEFESFCKAVCMIDNDETYFMRDSKCYCANFRDLTKFNIKVPKQGSVFKDAQKRYEY